MSTTGSKPTFSTVGKYTFADELSYALKGNPWEASISVLSGPQYRGCLCRIAWLGTQAFAGYAVDVDTGEIRSVFRNQALTVKGFNIDDIMKDAIEHGGNWLQCFDTVLPAMYARSGFRIAHRSPWNEDLKPEWWNYKQYARWNNGKPDYVTMIKRGVQIDNEL